MKPHGWRAAGLGDASKSRIGFGVTSTKSSASDAGVGPLHPFGRLQERVICYQRVLQAIPADDWVHRLARLGGAFNMANELKWLSEAGLVYKKAHRFFEDFIVSIRKLEPPIETLRFEEVTESHVDFTFCGDRFRFQIRIGVDSAHNPTAKVVSTRKSNFDDRKRSKLHSLWIRANRESPKELIFMKDRAQNSTTSRRSPI